MAGVLPGCVLHKTRNDEKDMDRIIFLFNLNSGVNHVSTYQLTVERGTKLFKQVKEARLHVPGEQTMAEMYLQAVKLLDLHGLHR